MAKKASQEVLAPVEQNVPVLISSLYPHDRNYRQHPPEQIKKLKASLERWGQVRSIVAQRHEDGTYTIVAGHGIVQAAQELIDENMSYSERLGKLRTDVIPPSWSSEQISGYLVADNHLSNDASDDSELLAQLLQEQYDAGYDLASLGSDEETLRQMLWELGDKVIANGNSKDGNSKEREAPEEFESYGEDIETQYCCPKCGYNWSGKPK